MRAGARRFWKWARTLQKLISQEEKTSAEHPPHLLVNQGRCPDLQERLRFIFPPEIERDDGAD